ncbi:MAG: hypothetical protein K5906_01270 [Bacilli bacterium]|nr:hypothetical protein [Bacilli bacterium]
MFIAYTLTKIQITFIVVASVAAGILLMFFLILPILKIFHQRNYKSYYYRKIYNYTLNHDLYLINNFVFKLDSKHNTSIDHILFGEKFIYIIMDKWYDGDLMGNSYDASLILIAKNGSKNYVDNPYVLFNKLLSRLSTATGINTELMIGITMINNDCRMKIDSSSKQFFMIQRKRFPKLIDTIEAREVGKINAKALQEAVLTVNNLNRRDKVK